MLEIDPYKTAVNHVLLFLRNKPAPTVDEITPAAAAVVDMLVKLGTVIDNDALIRHVEAAVNVSTGKATILDDDTDHQAWLPKRRGEIEWRFWERYKWYLVNEVGFEEQTVKSIDEVTDSILERIENPRRDGGWDRRGMVAGDVQSGKTANYIGLLCKAADAGYEAIIILAGVNNDLRSQTQERVDMGFLGFDTEKNLAYDDDNKKIGVGLLAQREFANLPIMSLTSSKLDGDFKKNVANALGINQLGNLPIVLVVKKFKPILERLGQWLNGKTGDAAALVIDDEADHASVNTRSLPGPDEDPADYDPSRINELIRVLLMKFRRRAYIGYTATPFANVFILPDADHPKLGPDLFPSAFIINLPTPSNHVGPAEVFGLSADPQIGLDEKEGMPVIRLVDEAEAQAFMPHGHRTNHRPAALPPSLKRAIRSFLVSGAMRGCRGQEDKHQSMLVHVTRWQNVQKELLALVKAEVEAMSSTLRMEGRGRAKLMEELKVLWDEDYAPTMASVRMQWPDPLLTPVEWRDVQARLSAVASRIEVTTVNGEAGDIRRYKEAKHGCYVIAIGGDKLSRGLTLEGLTISYFLRPSHMYDTLMQMGRWFGYRPGYLDACRLYTTQELRDWYQYIAAATIELRRDFDYMTLVNGTPRDFGLRVRQHPAELEITAANKMRTGQEMQVSFADTLVETVVFGRVDDTPPGRNAATICVQNLHALTEFLNRLPEPASPSRKPDYFAWTGVGGQRVAEFLRAYQNHPRSYRSRPDLLAEYIEAQMTVSELTEWTVVLVNNKTNAALPNNSYDLGHRLHGGFSLRTDVGKGLEPCYILPKHHLISPDDEMLDLDQSEYQAALEHTINLWKTSTKKNKKATEPERPNGKGARNSRLPKNGLLLLYLIHPDLTERKSGDPIYTAFAISFPASGSGRTVSYAVNNVYSDQFLESDFDADT